MAHVRGRFLAAVFCCLAAASALDNAKKVHSGSEKVKKGAAKGSSTARFCPGDLHILLGRMTEGGVSNWLPAIKYLYLMANAMNASVIEPCVVGNGRITGTRCVAGTGFTKYFNAAATGVCSTSLVALDHKESQLGSVLPHLKHVALFLAEPPTAKFSSVFTLSSLFPVAWTVKSRMPRSLSELNALKLGIQARGIKLLAFVSSGTTNLQVYEQQAQNWTKHAVQVQMKEMQHLREQAKKATGKNNAAADKGAGDNYVGQAFSSKLPVMKLFTPPAPTSPLAQLSNLLSTASTKRNTRKTKIEHQSQANALGPLATVLVAGHFQPELVPDVDFDSPLLKDKKKAPFLHSHAVINAANAFEMDAFHRKNPAYVAAHWRTEGLPAASVRPCSQSLISATNAAIKALAPRLRSDANNSVALLLSDAAHPDLWKRSPPPLTWKKEHANNRNEEGSVYNEQLGQVLQSMVTHTKEERLKLAGGTLSTSEGHVLYLKPDLFVEDWLKQNQALASTYSPPLLFKFLVERELALRAANFVGCDPSSKSCWECSRGGETVELLFKERKAMNKENFPWSDSFFQGRISPVGSRKSKPKKQTSSSSKPPATTTAPDAALQAPRTPLKQMMPMRPRAALAARPVAPETQRAGVPTAAATPRAAMDTTIMGRHAPSMKPRRKAQMQAPNAVETQPPKAADTPKAAAPEPLVRSQSLLGKLLG
mmetsp:Transcript_46390/g.100764  ORF Transcript_46390/g.100764 Transcript_46390/m.100764 type:complete len:709 (-) Transcript_46390:273-2399(-)